MKDDANWRDTGCEVSPSCLACPLPACRYEFANGLTTVKMLARIPVIHELQDQGLTIREIAKRLGVSRRGIQRSLSAARR